MDPVIAAAATAILVVGAAIGYFVGTGRVDLGRRRETHETRRLEEYHFYPFTINDDGHVEFDPALFSEGVRHLLEHRNEKAARELIVIGEQNLVRETFPSDALAEYKRFYASYDGDDVVSDNETYLENYRRLVNQLGRSVRNTGIEILLHNLVNPSRSLVAIENGVVTGRSIGAGATNLVLDLKTRRQRGEDKVNYELNIGSRRFKCTTVPIFRPDYGLVGAICVNIDANFVREAVGDTDRLQAFIDNLLRTDFQLGENILSKDEYQLAMRGKRHFMDDAIRAPSTRARERKLAAIFFSDIVGFSALMGANESSTLQIMQANEDTHLRALAAHGGRLLKKLGDGILASFATASGAVECALEIQRAVAGDGRYQIRVGIHLGEVVESDGDVHGDGVNIASRIQNAVATGQIGVSKVVYDNIKNKGGFTAVSLGEHNLKNVDAPMTIYSLETELAPSDSAD
jgi:class 3 adenylate cyclase